MRYELLIAFRSKVAKLEEDRLLKPDIDAMVALVKSQAFKVN
ncbi:MAG: hypothetical protein AAGK05_13610 [Pseudomonadota bacterium]